MDKEIIEEYLNSYLSIAEKKKLLELIESLKAYFPQVKIAIFLNFYPLFYDL
jgi:hypothetical protein